MTTADHGLPKQLQEPQGKPWYISDEEDAKPEDHQHGNRGAIDLQQRSVETIRGIEQVEADRWGQEPEFQVRDENDAEVDRVNPECRADPRDERYDHEDRRDDVHQTADDDQEDVESQQEEQR